MKIYTDVEVKGGAVINKDIEVNGETIFNNSVKVNGETTFNKKITLPKELWQEKDEYGIDLNNSDIANANAIYFKDFCEDKGTGQDGTTEYYSSEGLHFKNGQDNYDTLYAADGKLKFRKNHVIGKVGSSGTPGELVEVITSNTINSGIVLDRKSCDTMKTDNFLRFIRDINYTDKDGKKTNTQAHIRWSTYKTNSTTLTDIAGIGYSDPYGLGIRSAKPIYLKGNTVLGGEDRWDDKNNVVIGDGTISAKSITTTDVEIDSLSLKPATIVANDISTVNITSYFTIIKSTANKYITFKFNKDVLYIYQREGSNPSHRYLSADTNVTLYLGEESTLFCIAC